MKRFLIVGSGGREAAFAARLTGEGEEDVSLYAVMGHENDSIARCVRGSGGEFAVGDANDPGTVLDFAERHRIDHAFVNADQPLANGVVDSLIAGGIRAVGGTRGAARIEWDKAYAMDLMSRVCPEFTPFYRVVEDAGRVREAVAEFESGGRGIAVKPQGLTGGKGVKVMPEHLATYGDCTAYAESIIRDRGEKVVLVERIHGIEFTIMGITDGKNLVLAPASYDYPFRHAGDRGAGTGGMGCFTGPGGRLPFLTDGDLRDCEGIMRRVIDHMRETGLDFRGVLNGGFFKTREGIRFMEFNARFGDPEGINILCLLRGSFSELLQRMWEGTLSEGSVAFDGGASVTKYLVAKEYPEESAEAVRFSMDEEALEGAGVRTFLASCVRAGPGTYETLRRSRVAAFAAVADTVQEASDIVNAAIDGHVDVGGLEYRRDIGSVESLAGLEARVKSWAP